MNADPREIDRARRAVKKRLEGKTQEDLLWIAATNTELIFDTLEVQEDRIASLEKFRWFVVATVIALVTVIPIVVGLLRGVPS